MFRVHDCPPHKYDTGFKIGAVVQDVMCGLHFATFTQTWAAQGHCFHVGHRQSSGGRAEPRHFWGGRSLVIMD